MNSEPAMPRWRFDPDYDTDGDDAWFFSGCIWEGDKMVAWLTLDHVWGATRNREETQRNGYLLAAAPALYEALTEATAILAELFEYRSAYDEIIPPLKAALKLAEGENQ